MHDRTYTCFHMTVSSCNRRTDGQTVGRTAPPICKSRYNIAERDNKRCIIHLHREAAGSCNKQPSVTFFEAGEELVVKFVETGTGLRQQAHRAHKPVLVSVVVTRLRVAIVFVDVIAGERVLKTASAAQ